MIEGWYVELDFEGGGNLFAEWTQRKEVRLGEIDQDRALSWCIPPPPPPPPQCPVWLELEDGYTYCPASKHVGKHRQGVLCKNDGAWRDSYSNDCGAYEVNPVWCDAAHQFAVAGVSAGDACCICKGGSSLMIDHPCPLFVTLSQRGPRVEFPERMRLEVWQCFTLSSVSKSKFEWAEVEEQTRRIIEPVTACVIRSLTDVVRGHARSASRVHS